MLKYDYIYDTRRGYLRGQNKDGLYYMREREYSLAMIFDGVSSDDHAREGVDMAIAYARTRHTDFYDHHNKRYRLRDLIVGMDRILKGMSNKDIHTTCAIIYLPAAEDETPRITHLGDSRIYGLDEGDLTCYTEDDNLPQFPHILTKCLGMFRIQDGDFYEKAIDRQHDTWLLCTDGFYEVMEVYPEDFARAFLLEDLRSLRSELRELLGSRNRDDATYLIVRRPR